MARALQWQNLVGKPLDVGNARREPDLAFDIPRLPLALLRQARVHDIAGSVVLVVLPLAARCDWTRKLTPSELAVMELAVTALSNRAIARLRGTSENTVANQLASIYGKLGVSGRRELRALVGGESRVCER